MAPHAIKSSTPSVAPSVTSNHGVANPFGADNELKGTSYTSGSDIISQTIYSILGKIFSYETAGVPGLLDASINLWSQHYQRKNSFGVVPYFHQFEVRSGASSAILGYLGKNGSSQPILVLTGLNALTYMQPALSKQATNHLPISFNISAIDYDTVGQSLISNYAIPLSVARSLDYPVLTPLDSNNGPEIQHLTVLNHYLAFLTGKPSFNLFDGPEFSQTFVKFENLLSNEQLGNLYQELLKSTSNTDTSSTGEAISVALGNLNKLVGTNYSEFEYSGHDKPETVFVVYGTHETTQVGAVISKLANENIGLIKIRVPLPFNVDQFISKIPQSTKKLVVLGQGPASASSSSLKADITAALFLGGRYHSLSVADFTYPSTFVWTPITIIKVLSEFITLNPQQVLKRNTVNRSAEVTANSSPEGNFLIWGRDNGSLLETSKKLANSLSLDASKFVSIRNKFDNVQSGGIFQSQLVSTNDKSIVGNSIDSADVIIVEDVKILDSLDILATLRPGGDVLLIWQKQIKTSLQEDVIDKLPIEFKRALAKNHNNLKIIDFSIIEELDQLNDSTKGFSGDFLVQLAFWKSAYPELEGFIVNKLLQANGNGFELLGAVLHKFIDTVNEKEGIKTVNVLPEWVDLEKEVKEIKEGEEEVVVDEELPFFPTETSFLPNPRNAKVENDEANQTGLVALSKKIAFQEAYGVTSDLRPDLPVKNFVVKVQENKRLTPSEYSRNIFHIEFDTTGTGLTYDIGEALGIHGRNSSEEVENFLEFYGVDGDSLIEFVNRENDSIVETRSARQILLESIDFLGKPPKRFYESLAHYATSPKEREHLEKLSDASGAEELKKRQDVDFATYVDILEEFKSARPTFAELVKIIAPLKRREYSIASSQRIHPNAVHLLIVVVDWVDPKGRTRYGHCSKYLSDLNIGDELVVSVKPSVMKLPPLLTQPIIMSGLGTGLAPFKAFIEEKIWQKEQGMEIGEIYLFMGSRHKKEEYLYGELWEAYKDAGILTHIGAAFSRDQPEKIYIQDKIRGEIENLTDAVVAKNGSFYLCGPTWPVPDITACLEDIVSNGAKRAGVEIKDVAKEVEDMKEEGRYILEVY